MKLRVELNAVFSDTNANTILDEIENIKASVFAPTGFTSVPIVRKAIACEDYDDLTETPSVLSEVDFDAVGTTHNINNVNDIRVEVDISFSVSQDGYDFANYIEGIKDSALSGVKISRFYECNHDEDPLIKDGGYTYIDFTGLELSHPVV